MKRNHYIKKFYKNLHIFDLSYFQMTQHSDDLQYLHLSLYGNNPEFS